MQAGLFDENNSLSHHLHHYESKREKDLAGILVEAFEDAGLSSKEACKNEIDWLKKYFDGDE